MVLNTALSYVPNTLSAREGAVRSLLIGPTELWRLPARSSIQIRRATLRTG